MELDNEYQNYEDEDDESADDLLHPTTRALSSPSSVGSTTKQSVVSQASNPLKCLPPVILRTRKGDAQLAARTMIHWERIIATMCLWILQRNDL